MKLRDLSVGIALVLSLPGIAFSADSAPSLIRRPICEIIQYDKEKFVVLEIPINNCNIIIRRERHNLYGIVYDRINRYFRVRGTNDFKLINYQETITSELNDNGLVKQVIERKNYKYESGYNYSKDNKMIKKCVKVTKPSSGKVLDNYCKSY